MFNIHSELQFIKYRKEELDRLAQDAWMFYEVPVEQITSCKNKEPIAPACDCICVCLA